eukprot:jgi/Botrbrau1/16659/Bobra.0068s0075.1
MQASNHSMSSNAETGLGKEEKPNRNGLSIRQEASSRDYFTVRWLAGPGPPGQSEIEEQMGIHKRHFLLSRQPLHIGITHQESFHLNGCILLALRSGGLTKLNALDCTFPNCPKECSVYHQDCLEKYLKSIRLEKNRKTGFKCPRGCGKSSKHEPCPGKIDKSHPIHYAPMMLPKKKKKASNYFAREAEAQPQGQGCTQHCICKGEGQETKGNYPGDPDQTKDEHRGGLRCTAINRAGQAEKGVCDVCSAMDKAGHAKEGALRCSALDKPGEEEEGVVKLQCSGQSRTRKETGAVRCSALDKAGQAKKGVAASPASAQVVVALAAARAELKGKAGAVQPPVRTAPTKPQPAVQTLEEFEAARASHLNRGGIRTDAPSLNAWAAAPLSKGPSASHLDLSSTVAFPAPQPTRSSISTGGQPATDGAPGTLLLAAWMPGNISLGGTSSANSHVRGCREWKGGRQCYQHNSHKQEGGGGRGEQPHPRPAKEPEAGGAKEIKPRSVKDPAPGVPPPAPDPLPDAAAEEPPGDRGDPAGEDGEWGGGPQPCASPSATR